MQLSKNLLQALIAVLTQLTDQFILKIVILKVLDYIGIRMAITIAAPKRHHLQGVIFYPRRKGVPRFL